MSICACLVYSGALVQCSNDEKSVRRIIKKIFVIETTEESKCICEKLTKGGEKKVA